jgi:hypothetical protein
VKVCLFVEGGGSQERTRRACRKAFHVFIDRVLENCSKPRIVACGSRDEAYKDFRRSLKDQDTVPFLLVDSEDPVARGRSVSAHLQQRDHWNGLPDGQVHLMVQCMESWFLADKEALERYYGQKFKPGKLPGNLKVEEVLKQDVIDGLAAASKGPYHKTGHAFDILQLIDPTKVGEASPFAKRFFEALVANSNSASPNTQS